MKLLDDAEIQHRRWNSMMHTWLSARDGSRLRAMVRTLMEYKNASDLCDAFVAFGSRPRMLIATAMAFDTVGGTVWTPGIPSTVQTTGGPVHLAAGDTLTFNWEMRMT